MTPKPISQDLSDALRAAGEEPLPVIDPSNKQVYVVVDRAIHQRAMEALRRQESVEAIRQGVASMEAGNGMSLQESQRRTKAAISRPANE